MAVQTSTVEVVMPAMGDSVAEGTVLEWHKQEGDSIAVDETLVEISTDKVDAEVPSPVAGTIVKLHAAEGDTVAVGAVLAEIATNGTGGPSAAGNGAPATPVSGESPPTTVDEALAGAGTEAEGVAGSQSSAGQTIEILPPTGGESVTEGTILEWSVKVGDTVKDGDTVVEISTDKVDMELPAPASGTITEILAQDGETVTVGQVIARMTATPASAGHAGSTPASAPQAGASAAHAGSTPASAPPAGSAQAGAAPAATGNGASASPVAQRIAAAAGGGPAR